MQTHMSKPEVDSNGSDTGEDDTVDIHEDPVGSESSFGNSSENYETTGESKAKKLKL